MTNTLEPMKPRPDSPIDLVTLKVIKEVHKASVHFGFPVLLVGATARIILLENVHGLDSGRATADVDFAFALDHWDQFNALKAYLVKHSHCKADTHISQRLYMKMPGVVNDYKVDLIPFGGVEHEPNSIAWPPDKHFVMNVAGYQDALVSSIPVEVEDGVVINVASIPGIAILKLFAWADRGREDPKDAIDLATLLRMYYEAGNAERIYTMPSVSIEAINYDPELAGAWLLGNDATLIASADTRQQIGDMLIEKRKNLMQDIARGIKAKSDALDYAEQLLDQFTKGFRA